VNSPTLSHHHEFFNFLSRNPFEILLGCGIPFLGYVYHGQTANKQIKTSQMIMHTRVYGQVFAVTLLLSLMGVKAASDYFGTFVTQDEADGMVEEARAERGRWVMEMERNARVEMERREGAVREMKGMVEERRGRK